MDNEEFDNLDEKVLTIPQRQRRAQIARRNQGKLERARMIAQHRMAPEKNIKTRAYKLARKLVRTRVAGKRGASYEDLGPSEKILIDKQVESKAKLIKRLASRLMPRVKQAEQKRLQSFLKGQALANHGSPEGGPVKEELDEMFAEAFAAYSTKSMINATPKAAMDDPESNVARGKASLAKGNKYIIIHSKFNEEREDETAAYHSLVKKSDKSGISIDVLGEVFDRGYNSWTEDMDRSAEQVAFLRVNSFISKGRSYYNEDYDLHDEHLVESRMPAADRKTAKHVHYFYKNNDNEQVSRTYGEKVKRAHATLRQKYGANWRKMAGILDEGVDPVDEGMTYRDSGARNMMKASMKADRIAAKDRARMEKIRQREAAKRTEVHESEFKGWFPDIDPDFPVRAGSHTHIVSAHRVDDNGKLHHEKKEIPTAAVYDHYKHRYGQNGLDTLHKYVEDHPKYRHNPHFSKLFREETDPCWVSHKMIGLKKKNGKTVPNCVKESVNQIDELSTNKLQKYDSRARDSIDTMRLSSTYDYDEDDTDNQSRLSNKMDKREKMLALAKAKKNKSGSTAAHYTPKTTARVRATTEQVDPLSELTYKTLDKFAGRAISRQQHYGAIRRLGNENEKPAASEKEQKYRKAVARAYDKMDAADGRTPEKPVKVPARKMTANTLKGNK